MRPRLSVKGSTRPPSQSSCTPRETRRKALTPPRASLAITRSRWSPATTARKWAATRRVSSSTRTIASWRIPRPISRWRARSRRSPAARRLPTRLWASTSKASTNQATPNISVRPSTRSGTTGPSCSSSPRCSPWNGGCGSGMGGYDESLRSREVSLNIPLSPAENVTPQFRYLILDHVPKYIGVDAEVCMSDPVSHPGNFPPFHLGHLLPYFAGNVLGRFSDDLDVSDNSIVGLFVREERLSIKAKRISLDLLTTQEQVGQVEPPLTGHG